MSRTRAPSPARVDTGTAPARAGDLAPVQAVATGAPVAVPAAMRIPAGPVVAVVLDALVSAGSAAHIAAGWPGVAAAVGTGAGGVAAARYRRRRRRRGVHGTGAGRAVRRTRTARTRVMRTGGARVRLPRLGVPSLPRLGAGAHGHRRRGARGALGVPGTGGLPHLGRRGMRTGASRGPSTHTPRALRTAARAARGAVAATRRATRGVRGAAAVRAVWGAGRTGAGRVVAVVAVAGWEGLRWSSRMLGRALRGLARLVRELWRRRRGEPAGLMPLLAHDVRGDDGESGDVEPGSSPAGRPHAKVPARGVAGDSDSGMEGIFMRMLAEKVDEIHALGAAYDPRGMMDVYRDTQHWGGALDKLAGFFHLIAEKAGDGWPLHADVVARMSSIGDALLIAADGAREIPGVMRACHPDDFRSVEAPRRGERRWDSQENEI